MKAKLALVSMVTSLALVAVAPPAHAQVEVSAGNAIGTLSTVMGIGCNLLNVVGLPLCGH